MAVGLIAELARAGVSVPGDVMVAGFDDIPLARHLSPGLTTMQVNIDRLGSTGMMLLLRLLRGDALGAASATILTPNLLARGPTASLPGAARASAAAGRSAARRVGEEGGRTCRSRGAPHQ